MTNDVDAGRKIWQWGFRRKARAMSYRPLDATTPVTILGFIRGIREADAFAGAQQADIMAVLDADEFTAKVAPRPRRLDRLLVGSTTYAIEQVRGAPDDGAPVFFKVLLRGGQQ